MRIFTKYPMILLVSSEDDLTVDYLISRIEKRGLPFFRFNTDNLMSQYDISIAITDRCSEFIITDKIRNISLMSQDIGGAYFRKPRLTKIQSKENDGELFNDGEMRETLRSLWRIIPNNIWLNSPESLWLANNKIKQLMLARDVGFKIPDTLISSRPEELLSFINEHDKDVIVKAVKNGFILKDKSATLIFTSKLDVLDQAALATSSSVVPSILQPRLNKRCDLRITVVGNTMFPAALLSQQHSETSVDWRTWDISTDLDLKHEVFELPKAIEKMCLELNRRLGLNFSCIDMVLTENGDFYFLEVNPNGQWAWIEALLDLPIRDTIITQLNRGM